MTESSRQQFLAATGTGAVAVGSASVLPVAAQAATAPGALESELAETGDANPVVITVDDAADGRLSILQGEREFSFTDRDLADRIVRVLRREV